MTTLNEAVDWSAELGGGTRVALIQAGRFRSDAGALLGVVPRVMWKDLVADEIDADHRLLAGPELPSRRDAGRSRAGGDGHRRPDQREGPRDAPAMRVRGSCRPSRTAGFAPDSVDAVAVSHLHYDHAGGVLRADGSLAFPRARFVAQRAEWEIAMGENPRLVAGYDQPELRLIRDLGCSRRRMARPRSCPVFRSFPTGGHSAGHQGVVVRGRDRTVGFFGDLCMRPWSANPNWVTAFDDFPLDSVAVKADALRAGPPTRDWTVVLSHEPLHPVGRLVRDRDRFRFEPLV